jgi:PAS domain S-box-containing protein
MLADILYIDDEFINLQLFEAMFSRYYSLKVVSSTAEAEELLREMSFKVIVSDISMPHETGISFFKRIKFEEPEPILILLTAYVSNDLLLQALNQTKIFQYLTKPWNSDEVRLSIDHAIQIFDLHAQNVNLFKQIKESEQNFHNIFQYSKDAIVILNDDGLILEANLAFTSKIGKDLQQIQNCSIYDFLPASAVSMLQTRIRQLFQSPVPAIEYQIHFPEHEILHIEATTNLIEYKGQTVILSVLRDITDRKATEKRLLNAIIKAEETERSRIAKDLHDGLGPIMATLKMYLEWLSDKSSVENHPDILVHSVSTINEAIVTLKNISNNISPHILEKFGIKAALNSFVDKVKRVSPIIFKINVSLKDRVSSMIEVSVYRIIVECINNSLKHSNATNIAIEITQNNALLHVSYEDNGIGFDFKKVMNANSGMGLHNMYNRIKTLGGTINIESEPNKGIKVNAEIPLNNYEYGNKV